MPTAPHTELKGRAVDGHLLDVDLAFRAVRLEFLDADRKSIGRVATGFLIFNGDKSYLVTCWHAVTGYTYPNPEVKTPPIRRSVKISSKIVEQVAPGHTSIHGISNEVVDLYDANGRPAWRQQEPPDEPHRDLNAIGIRVPQFLDAVALPIEHNPERNRFLGLSKLNVGRALPQASSTMTLVGYPYGYSVFDEFSPEPVFVKRNIAAVFTMRSYQALLDGVGARGMSGSPVFSQDSDGRFVLSGIYTGSINPSIVGGEHDLYASLGAMNYASALSHIPELGI